MFHLSKPRSRVGLAAAAVIGLLAISTSSVAAATGPGGNLSYGQDGKSADASSSGCASNGDGTTTCSDVGISLFVGTTTDDVNGTILARNLCLNLYTYTYVDATGEYAGEPTSESGCQGPLPNKALRFGGKLTSVTLATTTVSVGQEVCDKSADPITCVLGPTHDVKVAGTWTGDGPTTYINSRSVVDDGTCQVTQSEKSHTRGATFVGTFNGSSLNSDAAQIADGKTSFRSRCVAP
jgi:hypothetical protein